MSLVVNQPYSHFIRYKTIILNDEFVELRWAFQEQLIGVCRTQELQIYIESSDTLLKLKAGELFYIAAGQTFMIDRLTYSVCRLHLILFDYVNPASTESKKRNVRTENREGLYPILRQQVDLPMIHSWLDDFELWNKYRQTTTFFRVQSHLYSILAVFSQISGQQLEGELPPEKYIVFIKRELESDYSYAWDMLMLVRKSKMSESRFYQLFRLLTGHSPLRFVRQARLQAALQLLATRRLSVTEVAHQIGYGDELYFSRIFKKYMGITPTDYSERTQIAIANLCAVFSGDFYVLGLVPRLTLERYWQHDAKTSLELIRKTHPDLIVSGMFEDEDNEQVSTRLKNEIAEIAAFEMIAWKQISWKQRLLEIASRLDLKMIAERWLSDYEQKIVNGRQFVKRIFKTEPVLLVCVRDGEFWLFGGKAGKVADLYYDDLGASIPDAVSEMGMQQFAGAEELVGLSCKHIILIIEDEFVIDEQENFEQTWSEWKGDKASYCVFVQLGEWFSYNAQMHERVLDATVEQLLQLIYR